MCFKKKKEHSHEQKCSNASLICSPRVAHLCLKKRNTGYCTMYPCMLTDAFHVHGEAAAAHRCPACGAAGEAHPLPEWSRAPRCCRRLRTGTAAAAPRKPRKRASKQQRGEAGPSAAACDLEKAQAIVVDSERARAPSLPTSMAAPLAIGSLSIERERERQPTTAPDMTRTMSGMPIFSIFFAC